MRPHGPGDTPCKRSESSKISNPVSRKAAGIPPFIVMDVLERAQEMERAGKSVIHLEVGQPDFDTPEPIKQAAIKALADGHTQYTHSLGLPELREEIAAHYRSKYAAAISPDQVVVTMGTSPALQLIFSSLLDPGDEIIVSNPYYACYPNIIRYADGTPVFVGVAEETGFAYQAQEIRKVIGPRTKGIMINSPSNPTGIVMTAQQLRELASLEPFIISDEIYHGLVYKGREHSVLEFTDKAFVVNGFSKLYAMTGWRLGYLIAPVEFVRPIQKMQQNLFICAGSFAQHAAIVALKECKQEVQEMVAIYDERRRFMLKRLREMGLGVKVEPTGAFYILANARSFTSDSYSFAFRLLEETGVAVTPGIDFGSNAEGYLRFSYANSLSNIAEAMDRIEVFLAS